MEEPLNCHLRKIAFENFNVVEDIGTEVETGSPVQDQEKDAPNKEVKKWSPSDEDIDTEEVEPGQVKDALIIPTKEEVKKWKRQDVIKFLNDVKEDLDLDEEDIETIKNQKVAGQAFLELTTLDLERWGMAGGPAITITKLIKEIKGEEQGTETLLKRTWDQMEKSEAQRFDIMMEFMARQSKPRSAISLSKLDRPILQELLDHLRLSREPVGLNVEPTSRKVKTFQWGDQTEDKHAEDYISFLDDTISLPPESMWYNPMGNKQFLTVDIDDLPFRISGTADEVIVKKAFVKTRNVLGGMQVVFEIKKKIEDHHTHQAIGELLVANILSEQPVFAVLTDLNEEWIFYWLSTDKKILESSADLRHAISILEIALRGPEGVGSESVDFRSESIDFLIARRCNIREYRQPMQGSVESNNNEDGLERFLRRTKVHFEFEDDVANMADVFDVMTPEEILEWKTKKVLKLLAETPGFQSSFKEKTDYEGMYL